LTRRILERASRELLTGRLIWFAEVADIALSSTRSPIVPFHVPRHWEETSDYFGTIATTLGGLAMVGKQPMAAWLAIAAAMLGVMNARPLTEKKDKNGQSTGTSPWGALA